MSMSIILVYCDNALTPQGYIAPCKLNVFSLVNGKIEQSSDKDNHLPFQF
jgi:hypothetical protein